MAQRPSERRPDGGAWLEVRAERQLIRSTRSRRHVLLTVRTGPATQHRERQAIALALVLDRSGSMSGEKLVTAKRAAQAVVERLDERDTIAVVAYDDQIDVLQPAAQASRAVKERLLAQLRGLEARASTALHEGWLSGCNAIAPMATQGPGVARCFLLTDGLANVGLTDPEQIAVEAAGVRTQARISTSTFGIGADYDEGLLGPMAVAGGGQFTHLRSPDEITRTFLGSLGELFTVVAGQVALDLDAGSGVDAELVSSYWLSEGSGETRWSIELGDLGPEEERRVVVRLQFPTPRGESQSMVRARLRWTADGHEQHTDWDQIPFTFAGHDACDRETADPETMHWVGLHHAERARREAAELSKRGDLHGSQRKLQQVAGHIAQYAGNDAELQEALADLSAVEQVLSATPASPMMAKEMSYQTIRRSRGQRDLREP